MVEIRNCTVYGRPGAKGEAPMLTVSDKGFSGNPSGMLIVPQEYVGPWMRWLIRRRAFRAWKQHSTKGE